jgi:hypothetical protein
MPKTEKPTADEAKSLTVEHAALLKQQYEALQMAGFGIETRLEAMGIGEDRDFHELAHPRIECSGTHRSYRESWEWLTSGARIFAHNRTPVFP